MLLFIQLARFPEFVLSSLNTAKGIHEKSSAEQIDPAQTGRSYAVGDTDQEISQAYPEEHLTDAVQMGDSGIHVRIEIEGSQFSRFSVIVPLDDAAYVFYSGLS